MEREEQKLDLYCVAHDVIKDIWIAFAIALSVACFSYIGAELFHHPTYTSSATLVIIDHQSVDGAYTDPTKADQRVEAFKSIVNSDVFQKTVSDELGVEKFPGKVTVDVVPEANLTTLSITAYSPQIAFETANKVLECYPQVGEKVLGDVVLEIFEKPAYPVKADGGYTSAMVMVAAFVVAFGFICLILAVVSWFKDAVKNGKEVPIKLDTTVCGIIHHEHSYQNLRAFLAHKKKKLLISSPAVSFGYKEDVKKVAAKVLYALKKDSLQVVLITSAMKEEGRSTIAVNLSQAMANHGRKVLLVEGDLRNSELAECIRVPEKPKMGWGEAFQRGVNIMDLLIRPKGFHFDILFGGQKIDRSTELLSTSKMKALVEAWKEYYDIIIIDGPKTQGRSDTESWAKLADLSLLVVKQNCASTKSINDAIDMLDNYGEGLLGCIFNDAYGQRELFSIGGGYGYGRNYGKYYRYGKYGKYGRYAKRKEQAERDNKKKSGKVEVDSITMKRKGMKDE